MALKIYNTLTRKKEDFKPLHEGHVGMYVCGPTVYGHSHIGHGKSYVSFDVIVRYLRYSKYTVEYVQNITDVGHLLGDTNEGEDRLLKQSRLEHKHPMEIAEFYTRSYFEDMDALGVVRPDISPRATGHIIEQIEIIKHLMEKGFAYEVNGSVYFDVSKDKEYGKLSGRSTEDAEAGTRVGVKTEKRHPNDFALWKFAEPEHIMRWPSPWGVGFPGWHIECSAMSMKYLGETFDIHGGGMDNQFPHHECEIAQSECATGKPFVRHWIHNNLVTVNGQKMSKSLGNFTLLKDLFKKHDPLVVRFFILQSHYHSTLDFTDEALEGASKGYEKLFNTVRNVRAELKRRNDEELPAGGMTIDIAGFKSQFLEAMNDDFNTPQAMAILFEVAREVNSELAEARLLPNQMKEIDEFFMELGGTILGIFPTQTDVRFGDDGSLEPGLVELIIDLRNEIRKQKLWTLSDQIRDGLQKLGIVLEDKKDTTTWKRA
ncbi:MAG: cysteine--tRNA ligase [Ignavibacteriae bacterium]|nr:cysteine--tRNA ligase [Ignavibacteria bacterium]MBI3365394.1 cysteine--tRNA ligase [Ignavibacteriota bacterium]